MTDKYRTTIYIKRKFLKWQISIGDKVDVDQKLSKMSYTKFNSSSLKIV